MEDKIQELEAFDLHEILAIREEAKRKIKKLIGPDFSIDISIEGYGINHPAAIAARDLDWKPGRQDDTAWYERADEYGSVTVYVE